jgi:hypothetical protein
MLVLFWTKPRYIGSLKPFIRLKQLKGNISAFAKPEDKLVEVLPVGLEEITTKVYTLRELEQLVEWVELRSKFTPLRRVYLNNISFNIDRYAMVPYLERLRAICKATGISLLLMYGYQVLL